MIPTDLKEFLDDRYRKYSNPSFIVNDPVSVPHGYSLKQDIEITGLWTAILSWGQRATIIRKAKELFSLMDKAPCEFILHHRANDLKKFLLFCHRTFNATDTLYFIHFLNYYYTRHESLEDLFLPQPGEMHTGPALERFREAFFSLPESPTRTKKHIPSPGRNSACKRLNMFLRWMVRPDSEGVDFGIWKRIGTDRLICPCDLHVERVSRNLGLITRNHADWKAAVELTNNLKLMDSADPVKYDYALFGLGIMEKFQGFQ